MSGAKGLEPLTFSLRRHRVHMVSRERRVIDVHVTAADASSLQSGGHMRTRWRLSLPMAADIQPTSESGTSFMDQALAAVDLGSQQTAAKRLSTSAQREATRKPYQGDLVPGSLVQWSDSGGLRADIYSTSSLLQYASAGRRCIHPRRSGKSSSSRLSSMLPIILPVPGLSKPRAVAGVGGAATSVLPANDLERCTTSLGSNRTPSVSATASACSTSTTRQPATVGRWAKPSASQSVKDYLTSIVLLHSASTRRKVCLPYVRVGNL